MTRLKTFTIKGYQNLFFYDTYTLFLDNKTKKCEEVSFLVEITFNPNLKIIRH